MRRTATALLLTAALGLGLLAVAASGATAAKKTIAGLWRNDQSGVLVLVEKVPGTNRYAGRQQVATKIDQPGCKVQIPAGATIFRWRKAPASRQGRRSRGVLYEGRERVYRRKTGGGCAPFYARSSARLKGDALKVRTADPRLVNVLVSAYTRVPPGTPLGP